MRYAIVSDIHANLGAWRTALADIADMKADRIICLGDVLGYGAEPVEVLESVYRKAYAVLMGNHDAAVCGKMGAEVFTPRAQQAIARHRGQVSRTGRNWLANLPLVLSGSGFRCAHGDFSAPAAYNYILDAEEALPSWQSAAEQLLFVGHTHCPSIHVVGKSGTPHVLPANDFTLEAGKRYIVNPGSVGYPRSAEGRSTYCIFDDRAKTIVFRSLPFDHESYVASLRKAGFEVEPWLARQEAAQGIPELRGRLSFAQPLAEHQHARKVRQETRVKNSLRLAWSIALVLLLLLLMMIPILNYRTVRVSRSAQRHAQSPFVRVPDYELSPIHAYPLTPPDKNLLPDFPPALGADGRVAGWCYGIGDKQRQRVTADSRDGAAALRVAHDGSARFSLESPRIALTGTQMQAARMQGRVRRDEGFDGTVMFHLVAEAEGADGTFEQVSLNSFEARPVKGEPSGTLGLSRKVEFPKRVTHLRLRMEATFKGVLMIEQPSLTAEQSSRGKK